MGNIITLSAPKQVKVNANSTSSMAVTITPPQSTLGISFYRASTDNANSEVMANMSPSVCFITGLPAGSRFEVEAFACESSGACSAPVNAEGFTLPDGNFY